MRKISCKNEKSAAKGGNKNMLFLYYLLFFFFNLRNSPNPKNKCSFHAKNQWGNGGSMG